MRNEKKLIEKHRDYNLDAFFLLGNLFMGIYINYSWQIELDRVLPVVQQSACRQLGKV